MRFPVECASVWLWLAHLLLVGEGRLEYAKDETRAGYFKSIGETNILIADHFEQDRFQEQMKPQFPFHGMPEIPERMKMRTICFCIWQYRGTFMAGIPLWRYQPDQHDPL